MCVLSGSLVRDIVSHILLARGYAPVFPFR